MEICALKSVLCAFCLLCSMQYAHRHWFIKITEQVYWFACAAWWITRTVSDDLESDNWIYYITCKDADENLLINFFICLNKCINWLLYNSWSWFTNLNGQVSFQECWYFSITALVYFTGLNHFTRLCSLHKIPGLAIVCYVKVLSTLTAGYRLECALAWQHTTLCLDPLREGERERESVVTLLARSSTQSCGTCTSSTVPKKPCAVKFSYGTDSSECLIKL